jgi:Tol biopolymer transport system component
MPLTPGTRLGPYEIVAPLGAGGMGAVYRATDTKLHREVAIKVLPDALANDPDYLARFTREARVLASLNHPNIAIIHGVEEQALVMELVPGQTLEERIAAGPIPLEETLDIARQIAIALEAAHERGVIHRDLKPANVKVTPEGVVKVLDFGLAKAADQPTGAPAANSPTLTFRATQAGLIMGTAAYMSPEQAAGKAVDKRSDIWSFGVVLYEMLTGANLFAGETLSHTLADVLRAPIDLHPLPQHTPAAVRDLLRRCLNRDVRKRLRDIGDACLAIEEVLSGPESRPDGSAAFVPPQSRFGRITAALAAILALALAALAFVHFREQPAPAPLMRFQIAKHEGQLGRVSSVSPDGRRLAFAATGPDKRWVIWVRSLDTLDARRLPGTEGVGRNPSLFWSPDSRFIGFVSGRQLKKVDASGGPPQSICDIDGFFAGGTWAPDGTILFATPSPQGRSLMRVHEAGGAAVPLTLASAKGAPPLYPSFLPDARHFLYLLPTGSNSGQAGIYVGSLDAEANTENAQPLMTVGFPNLAVFAPSTDPGFGHILYGRDDTLIAMPFDARQFRAAGSAVPVAQGLQLDSGTTFSVSSNGVLSYRMGTETASRLLWFDRQGRRIGQVGQPGQWGSPKLSPDEKLLLVEELPNKGFGHLWTADPARGVFSRVNPGEAGDYAGAAVSPDGRVAFTYQIGGATGDIYVKQASGAGAAEPLVQSPTLKHPNHWSLDGKYIVYDEHSSTKQDLWIIPMTGDRKPVPFLVTPADETDAKFSPDTRWIAYSSDESGRREVYVQGFRPDRAPAAGVGKWQISPSGGSQPAWRRDGKELYYIAGGMMMSVVVKSTATGLEPGAAVPLFPTNTRGALPYDVAADGRFLVNTITEEDSAASGSLTVVLNWTASLKQ